MTISPDDPRTLLEAAYADLDYRSGDLYDATDAPGDLKSEVWIERGGWLSLAKRVGADKVFFVEENPVIIFIENTGDAQSWRRIYNRAWCMARPPLLFFAQPGELLVLDLTCAPMREDGGPDQADRILDRVRAAAEVQSLLGRYHRSQIESGRLFEEKRFGLENRADQALIRDLGKVREALRQDGLSVDRAHALIGRSIFVRYLEDRRILTEEFFRNRVAKQNAHWHRILDNARHDGPDDSAGRLLYFAAILADKGFTDELFDRLAEEFNGDLFPFNADERAAFTPRRLEIIREFLLGEIVDRSLFFFAYNFEIIPIELISSMYEEFLKVEKGKTETQGSFYTPIALVDFVLSRVLNPTVMDSRPRIMDPSCGSAIFLVEAFRRLVRHRRQALGRPLSSEELRAILRDQIAGIDVNPEAIRIAAFSLYLAMLHYLDPPDIINNHLPNLTYVPDRDRLDSARHFDILLVANAFDVEQKVKEATICARFSSGSADVVVGNPPWGTPQEQDDETRKAAATALEWCKTRQRAVGDKELSQAFVQRTLDLLRPGGRAGVLVSTGIFFKRHAKSREFREQWLNAVSLDHVVNFAAVRHVFFQGRTRAKGAVAPFASVVFENRVPKSADHKFHYYSAKETGFIDGLQAVLLRKPDLHIEPQRKFADDDDMWKVYWWGGHHDEALIRALRLETRLGEVVDPSGTHSERIGEGIKVSKKRRKPAKLLGKYKFLPTSSFHRYGKLPDSAFREPPDEVERERNATIYEGCRLLIKRGISQRGGADGRIVARLEERPFCFRHSIYGIRLTDDAEAAAKILLGISWSSVTRYFAWLTAGSWGMWHHEILKETILRLPVRVAMEASLHARITGIVDELRVLESWDGHGTSGGGRYPLFGSHHVRQLEEELDESVFDLFRLTHAERDLVRDMCEVGIELFYGGARSMAIRPVTFPPGYRSFGRRANIPPETAAQQGLDGYIEAFLHLWDKELEPDGTFRWRVIHPAANSPMLAVIFASERKSDPLPEPSTADECAWADLMKRLGESSTHEYGSRRIFIDGITRIVYQDEIIIVKQNERRLWTRSAAREDAEATLLEAIRRQQLNAEERQ